MPGALKCFAPSAFWAVTRPQVVFGSKLTPCAKMIIISYARNREGLHPATLVYRTNGLQRGHVENHRTLPRYRKGVTDEFVFQSKWLAGHVTKMKQRMPFVSACVCLFSLMATTSGCTIVTPRPHVIAIIVPTMPGPPVAAVPLAPPCPFAPLQLKEIIGQPGDRLRNGVAPPTSEDHSRPEGIDARPPNAFRTTTPI